MNTGRYLGAGLVAAAVCAAAPALAADGARGFYRYERNRLTIAHGCAVSLPETASVKGRRTLVVMSDLPIDCGAAAKSSDPKEALKDALRDAMQGSVQFTVGADGRIELGAISFTTWRPLDSFTAQNVYETTLVPAKPGRIAGTLRTNGVQKIEMATMRELDVDVTFDLPVLPGRAPR